MSKRRDSPLPESSENCPPCLLTSIHGTYTLLYTNEVDGLMVKDFLDTLADIAMAVAARKTASNQGETEG